MKRAPILGAGLVAGALAIVISPAWAGDHYREIRETFPYRPGQAIDLEFPIGQFRVEPGSGDVVEVEIDARCTWAEPCGLDKIELDHRASDRTLAIEVIADGLVSKTRRELRARIRVPRAANLEIEMSIGELEIRDLEGDLDAELGIGEVSVYAPAAKVRSVHLDAGIGEASLRGVSRNVRASRSALVGGEVSWNDGEGEASLDVEVGIGEVRVDLD